MKGHLFIVIFRAILACAQDPHIAACAKSIGERIRSEDGVLNAVASFHKYLDVAKIKLPPQTNEPNTIYKNNSITDTKNNGTTTTTENINSRSRSNSLNSSPNQTENTSVP